MPSQEPPTGPSAHDPGSLDDLLQETRVLLTGAQVLTAFLITVPFSSGFARLVATERGVYGATFLSALASLVLFTSVAAYHRLNWPLRDRPRFKRFATRVVVVGLVPLSLALVLATHLVLQPLFGTLWASLATGLVGLLIGGLWWVLPLASRLHRRLPT